MEHFDVVTRPVAALDRANVDTDQIIPKQFLKRIERTGYGEFLFFDWAKARTSRSTGPSSTAPRSSSPARTSAAAPPASTPPWALEDAGFRAIVAPSFADIFRTNCGKIGLLAVTLGEADVRELIERAPAEATVDLERQVVVLPSGREAPFAIDADLRDRLLRAGSTTSA